MSPTQALGIALLLFGILLVLVMVQLDLSHIVTELHR